MRTSTPHKRTTTKGSNYPVKNERKPCAKRAIHDRKHIPFMVMLQLLPDFKSVS